MKLLQKLLPWALPILVLVFVLSACGRDNKIHALDPNAQAVAAKSAKTQAQRANGAHGATDGRLSADNFSSKCLAIHGRIESLGTVCAYPAPLLASELNAGEPDAEQVILPTIPEGLLVIASGDAPGASADILLNGTHFLSAGERKLSSPGRLSFYATAKSSYKLSVSVWKCASNKLVGEKLEDVFCNEDILLGHQ